MAPVNVSALLSVLDAMIQNELALAELYQACSEKSAEEAAFWGGLAEMERRHAEAIRKISEIVRERPGRFEVGRSFNLPALGTVLKYVRQLTADLKEGRLAHPKTFFVAMDVEQSILESKYFEIVKSKDLEFQNLSSTVMKETWDHRNILKKKVDTLK